VNLSDTLAVVGILVGVAAIVVGVFAARRWGTRRRRVLLNWTATPLIPPEPLNHAGRSDLKITYRGIEVDDPHLVEFSLKNLGPSDISSETFDHGEAFVIHMNAKMYGLTALSHPNSTISSTIGLDGVVKLGPELFRQGQEWMVSAVVEGIPELTFDNPLIDTDVISGPQRRHSEVL